MLGRMPWGRKEPGGRLRSWGADLGGGREPRTLTPSPQGAGILGRGPWLQPWRSLLSFYLWSCCAGSVNQGLPEAQNLGRKSQAATPRKQGRLGLCKVTGEGNRRHFFHSAC